MPPCCRCRAGASRYTSALFGNGMVISALAEGGAGTIPWLLVARADKAH